MSTSAWDRDRPPEAYDAWRVVEVTNWREYQAEIRRDLAMMLEEELRPELERDPYVPGEWMLERAIAIVKGEDRGRA